jgi:hypothetical protein
VFSGVVRHAQRECCLFYGEKIETACDGGGNDGALCLDTECVRMGFKDEGLALRLDEMRPRG